jgi:oligopeptidase A
MLGFENYAALSIAPKMAKTVAEVDQFLNEFSKRAASHGSKDWSELQSFAKTKLGLDQLEPWDMTFVSEQLKQERYSFSENEVKQYFPLPKVLNGVF